MKKIKIGIPRALYYYRYGILWKTFFNTLGCKVILSPETNQEILKLSPLKNCNQICMPYKIYIGHALFLKDKCDYILIPTICDYSKKNKVCQVHRNIYAYLLNLINREQLLNLYIDNSKMKYQIFSLIKIAFKITKNPIKIIYSFIKAINRQNNYHITKQNENKNKLSKVEKKVLLVSNFYNLHDKYIMNLIIKQLKENNITYIYSDYLDSKTASFFSPYFSNQLTYKFQKETIGAFYYYKYQVDGIIIISDRHCNIDDILNKKVVLKNKDVLILNLFINEEYDSQCNKIKKFINFI